MASSQVLDEVRTAITEYYTLLSNMPHFPADSLLLPPPEGWPDMDVETLQTFLRRSEAAIEFARHLPALKPCLNSERAWITPLSPAFAYHTGETWPDYIGEGIGPPTPPHLFHLTDAFDESSGVRLCVDTEQGTIVELAGCLKDGLLWADLEAMPDDQKWAAYRALPAKEFFGRETVRLLNLFYIPVPPPPKESWDYLGEPKYYFRAHSLLEEEGMLGIQDEWEADHEVDSDYVDGSEESLPDAHIEDMQLQSDSESSNVVDEDEDEDEYEDKDGDMNVDIEEVRGLKTDTDEYERTYVRPEREETAKYPSRPLSEDVLRVYEIYKRNGWPYEHFDVKLCQTELLEVAQELEDRMFDDEDEDEDDEDQDEVEEEGADVDLSHDEVEEDK